MIASDRRAAAARARGIAGVVAGAVARLAAGGALLLAAACAPGVRGASPPGMPNGSPAADTTGPIVVLLSFDGLGRTSLERGLPLPNFRRLAERGVQARALVPSFPSLTFPNHFTLVTGRVPGHTGLVGNKMWDPALGASYVSKDSLTPAEPRWYRAEPLWTTAERQGVRSAVFFWPASLAPSADGVRPSILMRPYDDAVPDDARVDSIAAWLRRPAATRPRFVAAYVATVDKVGHRFGPDAPETDSAVVAADRLVGRLLDSLSTSPVGARVNVVVLSDHGMARVAPDPVVDLSGVLDTVGLRAVDNGPLLALHYDGPDAERRRARAYEALRRALARPGARARVWRRADTPVAWALRDEPRAGDPIVLADPGHFPTLRPVPAGYRPNPGDHGWDPAATPALDGIFLAAGPDVRPLGTVPAFANVHVYPFLARLLGVRPAPGIDGDARVLADLLAPRGGAPSGATAGR